MSNVLLTHGLFIHKLFESAEMTVCNIEVKFVGIIKSIITICLLLDKVLMFCLKIHLSNTVNKVKCRGI